MSLDRLIWTPWWMVFGGMGLSPSCFAPIGALLGDVANHCFSNYYPQVVCQRLARGPGTGPRLSKSPHLCMSGLQYFLRVRWTGASGGMSDGSRIRPLDEGMEMRLQGKEGPVGGGG